MCGDMVQTSERGVSIAGIIDFFPAGTVIVRVGEKTDSGERLPGKSGGAFMSLIMPQCGRVDLLTTA